MRKIFEDFLARRIEKTEEIDFQVETSGLFLIEISARAKSAKQTGSTDDEDLRVKIDGIKFPQLKNQERYLDSPASFSGGQLKNLKKFVYFFVNLEAGSHVLNLIPDGSATLETIAVWEITDPRAAAKEYGLDPELMMRLAKKESQFNPVSPVGAQGVFQLTDDAIRQIKTLGYRVDDPLEYKQNIKGGMIYFCWLLEMYEGQKDQTERTLAAWNWGQGNFPKECPLDSWKPVPDETKNFIRDVLQK